MSTEQSPIIDNGFWVFRDGRREFAFEKLKSELSLLVGRLLGAGFDERTGVEALIRCGEIEAALADAGLPGAAEFASLTMTIAALSHGSSPGLARQAERAMQVQGPPRISISPPEGFSYYGVRPSEFAECARMLAPERQHAAVLGIRSIGATLSAVVTAALRAAHVEAERITVRPSGHPYDRVLTLSAEQQEWIARARQRSALFVIVDEGPGRSGSTFLAVADALLDAGIARRDIVMLGSRVPDVEQLCGRNAAQRWNALRFVAITSTIYERFSDHLYVGGGAWREVLLDKGRPWPECWPQMERIKFLSPDRSCLYKYEGLGRIGSEAQSRSQALAEAGFGPPMSDAGDGYSAYQVQQGTALIGSPVSHEFLEHLAHYCAFRQSNFAVSAEPGGSLAEMVAANLGCAFERTIEVPGELFQAASSVITDGRMQPHEWLRSNGRLIKADGSLHGDDHFFPGPADIAWDLAGIAVEWQLEKSAHEWLVRRFFDLTGDDVALRLPWFMVGYSVFRLGWCTMAYTTVRNTPEEHRLRAACARYRKLTEKALRAVGHPVMTTAVEDSRPAA